MAIEVDHAGDDAVDHCKVRRRAFSTPRITSSSSSSSVSKLITIDEFGDTRRRRLPDEGKSSRDYKLGDCVGSGWDWDAAVEVLCNCVSEWHVQKVDLGCVIPRFGCLTQPRHHFLTQLHVHTFFVAAMAAGMEAGQ